MGAISGKISTVTAGASNDVAEFLRGNIEYGAQPEPYFSSHGGGAQETVAGGESGQGEITCNFDPQDPIAGILPSGALVALTLTLGDGRTCTGNARIGKHRYTTDRAGRPVEVTVPFVTHGAWTVPTT
jgi:hypothetical protein